MLFRDVYLFQSQQTPTMDRILAVGRGFLWCHDVSRDAAAFMLSQFLTRPDVKSQRLQPFVDWALDQLPANAAPSTSSGGENGAAFQSASELAALHGTLSALALIFKHGGREDVVGFASKVLRKLVDASMEQHPVPTVRRLATKIVNRIGLVFLPVRIAKWRYQRGARSLEDNLGKNAATTDSSPMRVEEEEEEEEGEEEMEIADEVEEIIEFLLTCLKDRETIVRWSAAKGVGRVTGRLSKEFADQVYMFLLVSRCDHWGPR